MSSPLKWFAMGAPYRNELKVQQALGERGVECFVPMVTHVVEVHGHKTRKTEPAVSNLIFVHATEERLKEVKPSIPRLQYKVITEDGLIKKAVVRDEEMDNFIQFLRQSSGMILNFVTPGERRIPAGTRVRVMGGPLDGVVGTLLRTAGSKSRTLQVSIEGLVAATVEISPEMVEILKSDH